MKKFTLNLKMTFFCFLAVVLLAFSGTDVPEETRNFIQQTLNNHYNLEAFSGQLKKVELNVTNTGICRYRKIFQNGKQEYYALNVAKIKLVDYYGTAAKGELYLRTKNDDVIVQTRNDKAGEIDSMSTFMVIPLKNIDVAQLNTLVGKLKQFNSSVLANNK